MRAQGLRPDISQGRGTIPLHQSTLQAARRVRLLLVMFAGVSLFFSLLAAFSSRHYAQQRGAASASSSTSTGSQSAAVSQHRVALVIGNQAYRQIRTLENPVNDAKLMAATLRTLGFDVIERFDQTKEQLEADFVLFKQRLRNGSVALLFYAGHGVQYGGRNYLIGTDMSGRFDEANATQGLLDIGAATQAIAEKSGLSIIILDACRNQVAELLKNHPNLADGFTEFPNAPAGTFVAYSTSPGKTANDGIGYENSFYTASLAANLKMTPSRIEDVFRRTQIEVEQNTREEAEKNQRVVKGTQVPWTSSSLKALFYFTPDEVAISPVPLFPASPLKPELIKMRALKSVTFSVPRVNERGTLLAQLIGKANYYIEDARGVALEMNEIPGGRFMMGASAAEVGQAFAEATRDGEIVDEETYENITTEMPQHAVNVNGFFMSRYEITQSQYAAVMGSLPNIAPQFREPNFPVVNVTWNEASEFCARLSRLTGKLYRLPTEAEWEYAARAGTTTPFAFGPTITPQLAVYNSAIPFGLASKGAIRKSMTGVGEISPANAFGLYDMHGNVWEWCADYWHSSYNAAPRDGGVWDEQEMIADDNDSEGAPDQSRVARGGSWASTATRNRSASRFRFFPTYRAASLGFRVVAR
jgi:formylglycine-generating enzyme required for sulfatase activity